MSRVAMSSLLDLLFDDDTRDGPDNRDPGLDERLRHIKCAALLACGEFTPDAIAGLYGVSRATVYRWYALAIKYEDAEADALRAAIRRSQPRRRIGC